MRLISVLIAIAALALPTTALGKGPSGASIDWPGTGGGLNISGDGESGGTPLGDLAQQAGFFPATFGGQVTDGQPYPMRENAPKGKLGPKYTITYTVPGPNNELSKLRQDVYPYATPRPVTYMAPEQEFWDGMLTHGGWYQSTAGLKATLVNAGLPKVAPGGSSSGGDGFFSTGLISILAAGLALLLGASAAIFMRRRTRPVTAA
jgi:hypothetical protein